MTLLKTLFIIPFIVLGNINLCSAGSPVLQEPSEPVQMLIQHLDSRFWELTYDKAFHPLRQMDHLHYDKPESTIIVRKRIKKKKNILYPIYRSYIC